MTNLLADIPQGNGPNREHVKMRKGLSSIARRVAMRALMERREDILMEVYAAGVAHAFDVLIDKGKE